MYLSVTRRVCTCPLKVSAKQNYKFSLCGHTKTSKFVSKTFLQFVANSLQICALRAATRLSSLAQGRKSES